MKNFIQNGLLTISILFSTGAYSAALVTEGIVESVVMCEKCLLVKIEGDARSLFYSNTKEAFK